jgi:hypothetical protein
MDETVVAKLFSITKEDLIEGESVHAEPVFNIKRLKHQASFVGASPMREMRDNRSSEANFKLFQSEAVTSRTDLRGEADKAAQSNSIRRDQKTPTNPSIMISPKIKLKHSPSLHSPNNSIPFSAQDPLRCQKTPIPANIQIKPVEVNEDTTHSLSRRTYQNFINKKINKKVNPNLRRMKRLFTTSEYIFLKLLPCCYHKKTKLHKFNIVHQISKKYTDILNIVMNLQDFKKLKYILFNKKQLAIFNMIGDPSIPLGNRQSSTMTQRTQFEIDIEAQKTKAKEFLFMDYGKMREEDVNRRLFKLFMTD